MPAVQMLSWEKTSALCHCPIPCPLTLIKEEYFSADSQRQMGFVNSSRDRGDEKHHCLWGAKFKTHLKFIFIYKMVG